MKWIAVALLLAACGAQQVKVDPVKVEPIHITVDVNLRQSGDAANKDTAVGQK